MQAYNPAVVAQQYTAQQAYQQQLNDYYNPPWYKRPLVRKIGLLIILVVILIIVIYALSDNPIVEVLLAPFKLLGKLGDFIGL